MRTERSRSVLAEESIIFKNNIVMILTIIIAFAVFFLGLLIGFLTAGLMAEARRCDDAEAKWMESEEDGNDNRE